MNFGVPLPAVSIGALVLFLFKSASPPGFAACILRIFFPPVLSTFLFSPPCPLRSLRAVVSSLFPSSDFLHLHLVRRTASAFRKLFQVVSLSSFPFIRLFFYRCYPVDLTFVAFCLLVFPWLVLPLMLVLHRAGWLLSRSVRLRTSAVRNLF